LDQGIWVLCDRFLDSTTVYQGAGRRLPTEIVERLNAFAVGPHLPGLTLVLDLDPSEARRRQNLRETSVNGFDRMEAQPSDFFHRVRQGYQTLALAHADRVRIIPAHGTVEETAAAVWQEVSAAYSF
jgi:dTMP kinase